MMTLRTITILAIFAVVFSTSCSTSSSSTDTVKAAESSSIADADQEVSSALEYVARAPESSLGYQQLAVIYIKRARRTGDFSLNSKAESAIKKGLEVSPGDVSVRKLQATLHLTFHRFAEAFELATQLANENSNDAFIYGILTDANVELGNYDAAVVAVQKMVDLRPNSSSYSRVAHIRSLNGDHNGAVEMFKLAARTADPSDKEAQAWCLAFLGGELWKHGKYAEAEKVYDEALVVLPDYYLALIGKGRVRASMNDLESATQILTKSSERVPNVDALILLGDIYTKQGNIEKAKDYYDLVEIVEAKIGVNTDQKRLALLWADNNIRLDEALAIVVREHELRKDINTADALAWVHYKKGNFAEAKTAITQALRLKSNDAKITYHAGMIEKALGNSIAARKLLEDSIKLNPNFDLIQSVIAKEALAEIKGKV